MGAAPMSFTVGLCPYHPPVTGWTPRAGRWLLRRVPSIDAPEEIDVAIELAEGDPGSAPESAPAPLTPRDPVPRFRADLRVARGASPGLLDVTDPLRGRTFTLYEFELGVARLLDGRRPASEVVTAGVRLGIPIDLRGLDVFVRQMWRYGFLAPEGTSPEPRDVPGTWAAREPWDEATRALFQTGVRLLRNGRGGDAAGYFEAVLDAHPGNAEATEMLALVASGRPFAASAVGAALAREGAPPRRARRGLAIGVAAFAAFVAGTGLAAYFRSRPGAVPAESSAASRDGVPAPAAAPEAPPEPPLPAWRAAPVEARLRARLADLVAPRSGGVRWKKRANAPVRKGERLGEVRVEVDGGASPELARRIAELERLAAQDPVYRDFLERARREQRRASQGRTRAVALIAPAAGILSLPPGLARRADEGAVLGWIADPTRWRLAIVLEGDPPPLDAECEVLGDAPDQRAPCRLVDATPGKGGRATATAEVAEPAAPWIGRVRSPRVRLAAPGTERDAP